MTRLSVLLALIGAVAGFAIVLLAHSGDGFKSGPLVFLALVASGVGTLVAGGLFVMGKRGSVAQGFASFSIALLLVLIVVPIMWPYPTSDRPRPLSREIGSERE